MYMYYVETLEYLLNFDLLLVYRSLGTLTFYLITYIGHALL